MLLKLFYSVLKMLHLLMQREVLTICHVITNLLGRIVLEMLPAVHVIRNFRTFYGTEGSLMCSQELATCPYIEPNQSNPYNPIISL
jgi:hypothetical protein